MLKKNQSEETFQYTFQYHSKDDTLDVKETSTPSTPNIPLRRSARTTKGIPLQ